MLTIKIKMRLLRLMLVHWLVRNDSSVNSICAGAFQFLPTTETQKSQRVVAGQREMFCAEMKKMNLFNCALCWVCTYVFDDRERNHYLVSGWCRCHSIRRTEIHATHFPWIETIQMNTLCDERKQFFALSFNVYQNLNIFDVTMCASWDIILRTLLRVSLQTNFIQKIENNLYFLFSL